MRHLYRGKEMRFAGASRVTAIVALAAVVSLAVCAGAILLSLPRPETGDFASTHPAVPVPARAGHIQLTDVTAESGVTFVHTHGGSGQMYITEQMSAGIATLDYNGDGLIDIYFLNGAPLRGTKLDYVPRNALYRNDGDMHFTDVTAAAGVGDSGYGLGVTAGDYDGDGDLDLYLNNFGPNILYRNNGDGTFSDVTEQAGVANGDKFGAGALFLDMDADGDLDLYVGNYIKFDYARHPHRVIGGMRRAASPLDYEPDVDTLYRNNGDGTFTDVSEDAGIAAYAGTSMGMVAGDFDNDGDSDIFICNDIRGNYLFQNDGAGHFSEVGLRSGVAYNRSGKANGSMGADACDFNDDGWLDLFMTTYEAESPVLYCSLGQGLFEDAGLEAGLGRACVPHVNWGNGFADLDNDGDRDLLVANGHLEEMIHSIDESTAYRVRNTLYANDGDGTFTDVTEASGSGMQIVACSRGVALEDMDNDGDVDVIVLNALGKPSIIRNDTTTPNHWLQVRLQGGRENLFGVGARVSVTTGNCVQIDEVHGGRGYQSYFGTRLYFGLGKRTRVDRVEVRWPDGATDVLDDVPVDQLAQIKKKSSPQTP